MKEAVDDIMVTLNEAASEVGMVGGMVESIAEAMAKVSAAGQTLAHIRYPFSWIPLVISFHANWFFQRTLVQLQGIMSSIKLSPSAAFLYSNSPSAGDSFALSLLVLHNMATKGIMQSSTFTLK